SLTSAAACFRFAGVIKLRAPSWSSLPHRPQFDSSFFQRSTSALVTGLGEALAWALAAEERETAVPAAATSASPRMLAATVLIGSSSRAMEGFSCRQPPGLFSVAVNAPKTDVGEVVTSRFELRT